MADHLTMIAPSSSAGNASWANMGGDQPRFGPLNGRLVTQQAIMTNVGVHKGMHEWRAKQAADAKALPQNIFSRLLSTGTGDAWDLLHIKPLDLIFTYKKQLQTRDIDPYNENRVQGIATLNGLHIENKYVGNQAAFEDQFRCLGYTVRGWYFGKPDQPETGVAVMVHGSKNFFYRGYKNKPLFPGDRMMWSWPRVDPDEREVQRQQLGYDNDHPPEREAAIIEPLHYGTAHYFVQRELTLSFDDKNFSRYLYTKARPGASENVSRDHFAAISLRTILQLNSFITLAAFQAYTGIDLPTPNNNGQDGSALNDNDFNRNRAVEQTGFKELVAVGGKLVEQNPAAPGELQISRARQLTDAIKQKRSNQLEFWAAKLGCAPSAKPAAGDHARNMANAILAMTLQPLLCDRRLAKGADVRKFFSAQTALQALRPSRRADDRGVGLEWNEQTVVGSLGYLQSSAATDVYHALGEAIERIQDRCVGTCLGYTVAGDWGDEYH